MTITGDETAAGTTPEQTPTATGRRWGVPSARRVAPILRLPFQPEMLSNALSLVRQPLPLTFLALAGYSGSTGRDALSNAERELVILRTTWNCGGYFAYTTHLPVALVLWAGHDIQAAIEQGPAAPQWTPREAALLTVVDDLQRDLALSDPTRAEASRFFSEQQLMEVAAISATYEAVSMTAGSVGLHVPSPLRSLLRTAIPPVAPWLPAGRREHQGSDLPHATSWAVTDPTVTDTVARHPRLTWGLRWFGTLAPRFSALARADYDRIAVRVGELMAGAPAAEPAPANGWRRPVVLRQLVDELHTDRFVSDQTWLTATELFTDRELMDICVLVGGLRLQYLVARAATPPATG